MALMAKKHATCSPACMIMKWVVCILLLLVSIAALIGVYQTHVLVGAGTIRFQFGSTSGSFAILAFSIAVTAWGKKMKCCMMPCEVCSK